MIDGNAKKGCMAGCLISVAVLLGIVLLIAAVFALAFRGCMSKASWPGADAAAMNDASGGKPLDRNPYRKLCLSVTSPKAKMQVLKINLHGVLTSEAQNDFLFGEREDTGAKAALGKIRAATKDRAIRGLYLDVDSPGGGVTISDEIHDAITKFRASDTNRFVFVHMGDLCCSGGYYVSAPATWIMARPTTITGSIGVIMNGLNAAELAKKIGVQSVTIASGGNKSLLNPLEPVNPEHVKILERPVMQLHDRFVDIVAKGRNLRPDKVREFADGRVLSAKDALELGLVDGIGYDDDARAQLKKLAGGDVRICGYRDKSNFMSLFGDAMLLESASRLMRKAEAVVDGDAPRAEYRMK